MSMLGGSAGGGAREKMAMFVDELRDVELFRDLDDRELGRLAECFRETRVAADEVVFRSGEPAEAFYIVRSGCVVIYRDEVGKPMQLLARLGRGDFFGELGMFDNVRRATSARASELCRILVITKADLFAFLDSRPGMAVKLQMAAARRHSANVAAALELGMRCDVRIRIGRRVTLSMDDDGSASAVLANLSPGGLCLEEAPTDWQAGQAVAFQLGWDSERLPVAGRVAWRHRDTVGLSFTTRTFDHDTRIQQALQSLVESRA